MAPKPTDKLHKQDARQRPFKIPDLISDRLDKLCALVNEDGDLRGVIYRQDLVAAFIAFAPESAEELEKLIRSYEDLDVRDALVGDEKKAKVIRPVKPGRRGS